MRRALARAPKFAEMHAENPAGALHTSLTARSAKPLFLQFASGADDCTSFIGYGHLAMAQTQAEKLSDRSWLPRGRMMISRKNKRHASRMQRSFELLFRVQGDILQLVL